MLASISYRKNNSFFTTDRKSYTNNTTPDQPSDVETDYSDKTYSETTLAGLLLNLGLKINENNKITWKNLYSINTNDQVVTREGTPDPQVHLLRRNPPARRCPTA